MLSWYDTPDSITTAKVTKIAVQNNKAKTNYPEPQEIEREKCTWVCVCISIYSLIGFSLYSVPWRRDLTSFRKACNICIARYYQRRGLSFQDAPAVPSFSPPTHVPLLVGRVKNLMISNPAIGFSISKILNAWKYGIFRISMRFTSINPDRTVLLNSLNITPDRRIRLRIPPLTRAPPTQVRL